MRVILFRHGPAGERDAERWPDDGLRPLTPRGQERTRAAAHGLVRLEPGLRLIVSSPLVRALETARILESELDDAVLEPLESLRPNGSYRKIVDYLAARPADEALALVGHEPDLGKLAGVLLFGAPASVPLKKAGACAVDFEGEAKAGAGRLLWMLPPKLLRRLAGKKHRV